MVKQVSHPTGGLKRHPTIAFFGVPIKGANLACWDIMVWFVGKGKKKIRRSPRQSSGQAYPSTVLRTSRVSREAHNGQHGLKSILPGCL